MSLVALRFPSFMEGFPESNCVIIVGITARADYLGPKVLNGRITVTGVPKDL